MNRKGISAVIATLLLMVLAVASSVVVYSYTMGWLGGATGNQGGQQGALSLDSETCNTTMITAYVRNIGSKDAIVTHAYVAGVNTTINTITIAQATTETITVSGTYVAGVTYSVKFVAKDGTSLSFGSKCDD